MDLAAAIGVVRQEDADAVQVPRLKAPPHADGSFSDEEREGDRGHVDRGLRLASP